MSLTTSRTGEPVLRRFARLAAENPAFATVVGCILMLVIGEIVSPGFASLKQIVAQLTVAAILAIVAAGQGFAVLAGREGIDLSIGSVMSLAALLAGNMMGGQDAGVLPALLVAVAAGLAVGTFNGLGITLLRIPPLVMTLGTAGVVTGLLVVLTQGQTSGSAAPMLSNFVAKPLVLGLPGILMIWLLLILGLHCLLRSTRFGFNLYAIGSNDYAAGLSGVRVIPMRIAAYALAGAFAGFGGFLLLGYTGTVFVGAGEQYVLPSVIAVVIGGTALSGGRGSYSGTAAGAIFLTLLTAFLTTLSIEPAARQALFGLTLLAFMIAYGRERALR
jgi:ribose transport system permease protein